MIPEQINVIAATVAVDLSEENQVGLTEVVIRNAIEAGNMECTMPFELVEHAVVKLRKLGYAVNVDAGSVTTISWEKAYD